MSNRITEAFKIWCMSVAVFTMSFSVVTMQKHKQLDSMVKIEKDSTKILTTLKNNMP